MSRRAAFLLALAVFAHLPLLVAGYVQDDHVAIEANPTVAHGSAGAILGGSYWEGIAGGDRSLYRPLTVATYALERAAFGRPLPAVSHAVNVALHALTCLLVFSIARRCGVGFEAAQLAAFLFAVLPSKAEAVANVVGRAELLSAVFTLAAVRLALERGSRRAAWGAGACVLAACASKETGLAALPLVVMASALEIGGKSLSVRAANGEGFPTTLHGRTVAASGRAAPAVLAFVVFVIARTRALEAFFPPPTVPVMDNPIVAEHGARAVATALGLVARYARLVLFPIGLSNDYSGATIPIEHGLMAWRPILGLLILAFFGWLATRGRRLALFVAIAGLPYLLVSNLVVPIGAIMAERFLYLPAAGLCLLLSLAIDRHAPRSRTVAIVAIGVLSALMVQRSIAWKNDRTIFEATARNNPLSPRAPYWLGTIAVEDGRLEAAGPYFDAAIRNWPAFAGPWHEKGLLLARGRDAAAAVGPLEEAIRLEPAWAAPRLNLALVRHRLGDREGALRSVRHAVLLDPGSAKAWAELGHLNFEWGRRADAAAAYRRAIALGRTDLAPRLAACEP